MRGGVKNRLEYFQKFIPFGSVTIWLGVTDAWHYSVLQKIEKLSESYQNDSKNRKIDKTKFNQLPRTLGNLYCNYNGEIGQRLDLAITFDWGVL